jgi:hypothetical protein
MRGLAATFHAAPFSARGWTGTKICIEDSHTGNRFHPWSKVPSGRAPDTHSPCERHPQTRPLAPCLLYLLVCMVPGRGCRSVVVHTWRGGHLAPRRKSVRRVARLVGGCGHHNSRRGVGFCCSLCSISACSTMWVEAMPLGSLRWLRRSSRVQAHSFHNAALEASTLGSAIG